ncbi:DUF2703 domain-containing protein [Humidesulfovibrio sp.]|uniref:DUF2703 domain-containing protein n=1 Tax=Humidesulfovibrio sp. TaxID=2910988 RepID=UPI0027365BCE|nr:DUF2703 domain-containing protein [Humidesulfovibrio sp.]
MRLDILWQRVLKGAETCERCGETGESVRRAVLALREALAPRGIEVVLMEKALPLFAVTESNRVFIGGQPLEDLLGAEVGESHCQSCCDLLGAQTDCRTLRLEGREYEALSEELIVRAGLLAANRLEAAAQ